MLYRSREIVETGWTPLFYERSADGMGYTVVGEEFR
jgi:hypothetical protein